MGLGPGVGGGGGGQGRCEQRSEVFVIIQKKKIFFGGGGQDELKFLWKFKKNQKTSKFREFMSPAKIFLRNKESSENVKFIRGVTLTRSIMSTYVDSNNA